MNPPLFSALDSGHLGTIIQRARNRVCYAAPGIHEKAANALVRLKTSNPEIQIDVSIDFVEHTLRMGYGSLSAVETLQAAGIESVHSPGFRSAVLIVDEEGWVFTPTALYLEPEPQSDETPNAIRLTREQIREVLFRLSPSARREAILQAGSPELARELEATPLEVGERPVDSAHFTKVSQAIETAPPVKFDMARQVRIFEPYLQYVELSLTGAAVQRKRVRIPKSLQTLGASKDLEGKLRTTFDLIEKGSSLSSKALEDELNQIRKDLIPSLGKDHGRVVLKSAKPRLQERLEELRLKLETHQKKVEEDLQTKLDESRDQVVDYYLPLAKANPPDALLGSVLTVTEDETRQWIEDELSSVFPKAEDLIRKMSLEIRYKDVTFETLNRPDFLESVNNAFPRINWEKAYRDFKAAGESER